MLWLIRDRQPYYCPSYDIESPELKFLEEKAARTMIGHDLNGRLYLILVKFFYLEFINHNFFNFSQGRTPRTYCCRINKFSNEISTYKCN